MTSALGTIYVLAGPTAVGKTELALGWAEANEAEIVSCDSLLFYRGMDIGTAKPTAAERGRVPHWLIDIREPRERMDVAEYVERAIETVADIQGRGRRVLVTGGSGFYLKAFYAPVADDVAVDDAVRSRVDAVREQRGLAGLLDELAEANAGELGDLDTANPRRVAKALERCWASGESLAKLEERFRSQTNPLIEAPKRTVALARSSEELSSRIDRRVRSMLEAGLLDEVRRLRLSGFESNPSASGAIGYREALNFLDGTLAESALPDAIATNTRRLAKKQRTWLRHQLPDARVVELSGDRIPHAIDLFEA